jgi:predicted amidohydrolase
MPVLMANCVGFCDNFLSVGQSAVWTKDGKLVGQLDDKTQGILIFDTETEEIVERVLIVVVVLKKDQHDQMHNWANIQ